MLRRCLLLLGMAFETLVVTESLSCPGVKRDLVLLLDSSGSVEEEDFTTAKRFLANFTSELDVNDNAYQVAVVRFSDGIRREAKLGQYNDRKTALMEKINKIYHIGGGTETGNALKYVLEKILTKNNRDSAPDQILILTDGKSDNATATARQIEAARAKKVQMIAVGVGKGVNDTELRNLATSEDLMFKVDSYDDLNSIKHQLISSSCGITTTTPTTTVITTTTTTTTTTTQTTTTTSTTTTTTPAPSTEQTTMKIDFFNVTSSSVFNTTEDDSAEAKDGQFNRDLMNASLREKREMLSSASGKWKKVTGLTVGAFALTALITGLVFFGIRRYKQKRQKRFLETL